MPAASATARRPMRRQDRSEVKPLRGLRAPQLRTVDGRADQPVLDPLDRVAERQGRDRRRCPVEPVDNPGDQRGIGKRPRAVVDQHAVRAVGGKRFEAEPHRILPLGTAQDGGQYRQPGNRVLVMALILGPDRHQHASDPRMGREGRDRAAQHGAAAESEILLRQFAAEAGAAPGGNDQGIGRRHGDKLNPTAGRCQPREGLVAAAHVAPQQKLA